MKTFQFIAIAALSCSLLTPQPAVSQTKSDVADYVSTLVGSESKPELSTGNTYPAIALPWGMNFWTPQTGKMGDGWAYTYTADKIRGFKQTHQPSPWINDYGQFALMPMTGHAVFDEEKRASWFSHKAETARPYYYKVYLADYDVTTEIAPTSRAAVFRLSYPTADSAFIAIDAFDKGSMVRILPEKHMIVGYTTKNSGGCTANFKNWFAIQLDRDITFHTTFADGQSQAGLSAECDHAGAIIGFSARKGKPVILRVASSFISEQQALQNLKEVEGRSFDEVCAAARQQWNATLGRIEVEDDNIDNLRTFYSCLYRCLLFPRSFYEITAEGDTVHYSPHTGKTDRGPLFTDTGFWDTFRSLFPLVDWLYPEVASQMQEGWANVYRESGFLPEWSSPGHRDCMVGNNSASVVYNGWLNGLRRDEGELLWEAVTHGAHARHASVSSTGRAGWQLYDKLGYVPCDKGINESVARTLEYAYDDWCIYQLGRALGKSKKVLEPYRRNAYNYRNVFDKQTGLMRGRNADGTFERDFNPFKWGGVFTEGNSWHYTWSVFHDPQGLITLMGGREAFAQKLDSMFILPPVFDDSYYGYVIHEIREMQIMDFGNYAHGNQPVQHAIYLYDWRRGQRPDLGVVCILGTWLLQRLPRHKRVCLGLSTLQEGDSPPCRRRHDHPQCSCQQPREPLHRRPSRQRQDMVQELSHYRSTERQQPHRFRHAGQAQLQQGHRVNGKSLLLQHSPIKSAFYAQRGCICQPDTSFFCFRHFCSHLLY